MRVVPQVGICSYLANWGHRVTWVISSNDKHQAQPFFVNEAEVYATYYRHYFPGDFILAKISNEILNAVKRIHLAIKIFKERKCNIVFSREDVFDGLIATYIKKKYRVPFVLQLSNPVEQELESFKIESRRPRFFYYLLGRLSRFILTRLLHQADLILPISKWLKEDLIKQGIEESRMMPLPEGINIKTFISKNTQEIRQKYSLDNFKVMIYVGIMDKARQLSMLIHAFSVVRGSKDNVKLLMVGDGNDRENMEELAQELGIKDDVIFAGLVSHSEIPEFISAADIGISPVPPFSFYKVSSPIKLFEYMAMGKPVVANEEIFEHREVLEQSDGGILVPFTEEALANAIIELLNNPERAIKMGQQGREWVAQNRNYEILAKQLEKRLFSLLGDSSYEITEVEMNNLFFINKVREFNINKMELHPLIKTKWQAKCKTASNANGYKKHIQTLVDIIGFKKGAKILDVGCGVGAEVIELANLGGDCTGLDGAKDVVRLINKVRDDFGLRVRGVYGDACNMPLDDESFDIVMSWDFFEHVADFNQAMKEQIRVLKKGGRLIIPNANLLSPFTLFDLLIKYPIRTRGQYGGIKWLFTKGKVRENIYGTGWTGKDEDIHTRLWWKRKMKQYSSDLEIIEFTSHLVKSRGKLFRLLEPFLGGILIVATKRLNK